MQELKPSPIILVDVLHDDQKGVLVSSIIEDILFEKVLSTSTADTRLCVEGINTGCQAITPLDRRYPALVQKLWPNYTHRITMPTLYGADPRWVSTDTQNNNCMVRINQMLQFLDEKLTVEKSPSSIVEAIEWIRDEKGDLQLKEKPNRVVKKLADSLFRLEKTWIKNYANLAKQCARAEGPVYIVAGLSHIIGLHIQYGWPMMWLTASQVTPAFVYRSGMNFTHFLDLIRRME